jgi:hypothetical protein
MKNLKRAYRRHKKEVKFLRRLKKWIKPNDRWLGSKEVKTRLEIIEAAKRGECYTFLRTTGKACNCFSCTYKKYDREQKQYVLKEIFNTIIE